MTRSLVKNAHSKLQIELRAVVSNCISENKKVAGHLKYFDTPGLKEFIRIVAWPLKDSGSLRRLYVVSFEKILPEEFPFEFVKKGKAVSVKENLRVAALEQELSQTKEHLQSFIEEIETSNEELQSLNEEVHSANEELQAANEELETSNEELQSANEEMVVAYNELRDLHRLLEEKEALMELANLKMQAIMDNATQGYLLVDEKYTIVSLNHAANTIIPFFAKTALQPGDSFYNVVPANSFAVFKENFDKAWNGESTIREINLQSELVSDATDPDIWLQIRYAPVAGPNGKVEYVLISYIDLSEKVKTKQQIEASESKFRALIERGADMKTVVSLSGQHMYASPTITKVLGYSLEEFSKLRVSELLHPEGLPLFRENMRRVLDNQVKTFSSQQRLKHKNGNWIWCEGNVTNMLEEPGIKGLVANFRNINERKELEELLKKANTLARIGGWELNVEQGTLYWSDITKEIHEVGYDYTPDLEKAIHFYTEGPSRNLIIKRVKQAMEKGRLWDEELSLITAKNNECWVRCIGEAEFVNGKCIRIYGSFQDITGRKKAEESIKKSEATHRQLFNLSPAPMWVYDAETNKFTQVNKACTEQYGYSEEEFLGMTVLDISLQEEAGKKTTRKKKQFKTVFMGAGRHLKKNGEKIDVETSSIPIFLNDKNQVLVIAIDVTEKNLYEQKLAQASIKAQEDERYEIGAELHDNICQILATCQISLGMMKKSLPEEAIKFFEHTNEYIVLASDEIRNLSHHLAPAFFDDDTIQVSFERLLAGFNIEKKSLAF
jgi:PAS domain S-box-containing protein